MNNEVLIDQPEATQKRITEPLEPQNLEQTADDLLAKHAALGGSSGIYSQAQLERKIRNEDRRLPRLTEAEVCGDTIDALLERRIEELVDAAGLSALQEIIYRLHAAGFGCRRISSMTGIRYDFIERRLRTIKRKVRAAYEEGIYAGWYEVYLSEVNRSAYHRRK